MAATLLKEPLIRNNQVGKMERNIINDGVHASASDLRLVFRLFKSHPRQSIG